MPTAKAPAIAPSSSWIRHLSEQFYLPNTAVLVTRLKDKHGAVIEVTDFAPRFHQYGRMFMPMMVIRQIRRIEWQPAHLRARTSPVRIWQSELYHHPRKPSYPICCAILDFSPDHRHIRDCGARRTPFFLETTATLILGPDETIPDAIGELSRRFLDETIASWRTWVRDLSIPFEWQEEVIRAAITLKLNTFQDTGAIIAAMTTSIPEAPGFRSQLGLPLLLAEGFLFCCQCLKSSQHNEHHGTVFKLSDQCGGRNAQWSYPACLWD